MGRVHGRALDVLTTPIDTQALTGYSDQLAFFDGPGRAPLREVHKRLVAAGLHHHFPEKKVSFQTTKQATFKPLKKGRRGHCFYGMRFHQVSRPSQAGAGH
eukprot:scaffold3603_cov17-Tisochrysis_lutea.AAC.1